MCHRQYHEEKTKYVNKCVCMQDSKMFGNLVPKQAFWLQEKNITVIRAPIKLHTYTAKANSQTMNERITTS
jgi:hypothetical protein